MEDSQVAAALSTQLAERIGQSRFDLWFKLQASLVISGELLTVTTGSPFVRDWMRSQFANDLRECWQALIGATGRVEFQLADNTATGTNSKNGHGTKLSTTQLRPATASLATGAKAAANELALTVTALPGQAIAAPAAKSESENALPRTAATLSSFVVGASNEYAFRAAELTARGRQQASPLIFCGPTGVGKTHLLRSIVQEFRRSQPRGSALYLTAEQFTTCFIEALRGSGLPSFRQKCRGVQLLAIDDLQFFAGKQRTIEELLYTIDTLANDGRQIVLASDRGLGELRSLGVELVSRLSGGLTCELATPEFAIRLGIVRQLAEEIGVTFGDGVAKTIATHITSGARELRGAVLRLQAMSEAFGEPISHALAERGLSELARHNTHTVRLTDVEKVVCHAFGVEPAQLRSDRKSRAVAEPRMLAMWLARKYTRAAWSEIGEFFGRNSHSTVISAHRRVEKLIAEQGKVGMAEQMCLVDDAIRRLEAALRTA